MEEAGGRVMSTINNLLRALTSLRYTTIVECDTFCSSSPKIRILSMKGPRKVMKQMWTIFNVDDYSEGDQP